MDRPYSIVFGLFFFTVNNSNLQRKSLFIFLTFFFIGNNKHFIIFANIFMVVIAQLVRASVCGTEGRGFESH